MLLDIAAHIDDLFTSSSNYEKFKQNINAAWNLSSLWTLLFTQKILFLYLQDVYADVKCNSARMRKAFLRQYKNLKMY